MNTISGTAGAMITPTLQGAPTPRPTVTGLQRYKNLSMHPLTVLGCVLLGGLLGLNAPQFSKSLEVVGLVYVDLLKMIVLPFMISAVIFSLQKLFHDGGAARILRRVLFVFSVFSIVVAVLSAGFFSLTRPGNHLSEGATASLGKIVGSDAQTSNLDMLLRKADDIVKETTLADVLTSLIPSNIFASLASGDTLKALVFAMLFGFAVGQIPSGVSGGLHQTLETVYRACQTLTHWVNLPLPIVLISLSASQIADVGLEPLIAMSSFVVVFLLLAAALLLLSVMLLSRCASMPFSAVMKAMREPFALGVATNNSATCMPAMIEALTSMLGFAKARVELLVPLSVSFLKVGAVAYFVCATMFVADLYARQLSILDVSLVVLISILAGFASSGMAGVVTITLVGTVCRYLNLPFEAAFILFVAVDPLCAMARTAVTVVAGCAAVAVIAPDPVPAEHNTS